MVCILHGIYILLIYMVYVQQCGAGSDQVLVLVISCVLLAKLRPNKLLVWGEARHGCIKLNDCVAWWSFCAPLMGLFFLSQDAKTCSVYQYLSPDTDILGTGKVGTSWMTSKFFPCQFHYCRIMKYLLYSCIIVIKYAVMLEVQC